MSVSSFDFFRRENSIKIVITRPPLLTPQSSRSAAISRKFLFLGVASCLIGVAAVLTQVAENHVEFCALTYITAFWYVANGAGGIAVGLVHGLQPSRPLMVTSLILSAVNAGLSMVWILAFNVYIALWTKATETSKRTPLPNILVAHLLVSCLGVIIGTLMVIVCLSLMREAERFNNCDPSISGQSSRVEGTDLNAIEEDD